MERVYDHPDYYEVAFSYRDLPHEVAVLGELAARYSRIPVRRFLEVACGSAPHIKALHAKGYEYTGIDLNETMMAHGREKANAIGANADFICADLASFELPYQVDMAAVFLGSLYVTNNEALHSHFDSVGRVLRSGGLYVLDWCVDFIPGVDITDTWEESQDGVHVRITYTSRSVNRVEQTYEEICNLEVLDNGIRKHFREMMVKRAIYPQEFLLFVDARPDFEFVGWWNDWDLDQPLDQTRVIPSRPVIVIRRL